MNNQYNLLFVVNELDNIIYEHLVYKCKVSKFNSF